LPAGVGFATFLGDLDIRGKGITGGWFGRGFWGQVERVAERGWLKLRAEVLVVDDGEEQQVERSGAAAGGRERSLNLLRAAGRAGGGLGGGCSAV
jgi:hypothetical protein